MRALRFLVLLACVLVIAAACGNSDNPTGPSPTTPTTQAPPDTTQAPRPSTTTTTTTVLPVEPIVYLPSIKPATYQIWNTQTTIQAGIEPRLGADPVHTFAPTARDIDSTGRRADVDNMVWLEVELPDRGTGWLPQANLVHQITALPSVSPSTMVVFGLAKGDELNVRAHPGTDHDVLTTLDAGESVPTTGSQAEVQGSVWAEVEYADDKTGWVNDKFLHPEVIILPDDKPALYKVTGITGTERLNVRKGPGVHEPVVTTLPADAIDIQTTGNRAQVGASVWREIEVTATTVGWVNASFLELQVTPDPVTPPCKIGGDRFCPDLEVTRGMAAAFLSRALGLTDDGGKDWFTDDNGTAFETEINRLAAAGILRGCSSTDAGKVCPHSFATREVTAVMFSRALELTGDGGKDWFTDDGGSAFETEINRVAGAGIAVGCNPPDNTKFCPSSAILRGQMASWLVRAFDLPATSQDFWTDDDGSIYEDDINAITAANIAR